MLLTQSGGLLLLFFTAPAVTPNESLFCSIFGPPSVRAYTELEEGSGPGRFEAVQQQTAIVFTSLVAGRKPSPAVYTLPGCACMHACMPSCQTHPAEALLYSHGPYGTW